MTETRGAERAHVHHEVRASLAVPKQHQKVVLRAASTRPPRGKKVTYGGVVIDDEGRVLLRRPRGEYDGYVWTFAKGGPERGETPEQTALREVRQETGIEAGIVGALPGWFESNSSATRYFVMKTVRDAGDFDHETSEVTWVDFGEARRRIGLTRNLAGRTRDHAVLEALQAYLRLED